MLETLANSHSGTLSFVITSIEVSNLDRCNSKSLSAAKSATLLAVFYGTKKGSCKAPLYNMNCSQLNLVADFKTFEVSNCKSSVNGF